MENTVFQLSLDKTRFVRKPRDPECIVQYALEILRLYQEEGCGKCVLGREGLFQAEEIFRELSLKKGSPESLNQLQSIAEAMQEEALCELGSEAGKFICYVLEEYNDELLQHAQKKECPKGVCSAFVTVYVDPFLCTGCGECLDACPRDCIEGKKGYISMIDELDCIRCGKCLDVCENGAVKKASGKVPRLPERLTRVGKFKRR